MATRREQTKVVLLADASSPRLSADGRTVSTAADQDGTTLSGATSSTSVPLEFNVGLPTDDGATRVTGNQMVMNLVTGGLGTGILSLPWAMAGASVAVGVATIVVVVMVNVWTIMILVNAAERYKIFDLAGVLGQLPGRLGTGMQIFSNAMVWFSMMLCLVGYIIAMADSAGSLVGGSGSLFEDRRSLSAISALVVLPLCYLDQKYLSFTSTIALTINIYLIVFVCSLYGQRSWQNALPSGTCALGLSLGSVTMVSTMMQCVIIQMCVLPMYKELEDRSPQKFRSLLLIAFSILIAIFVVFAVLAYLTLGPDVADNVLKSLPRDVFANIAQAGTIVVVAAVYPIMLLPMVAPIHGLEITYFSRGPLTDTASVAQAAKRKRSVINLTTLCIVLLSLLVALRISNLGVVNVINGSLCVAVFTSLCPGLVGLHLLDRNAQYWRALMIALMIFGALMGIIGLIFTNNLHESLESKCFLKA